MKREESYDLRSVKLPRLTGAALRAVTVLMENPVSRLLVRGSFLSSGGISGQRGRNYDDPPSFVPRHPADGASIGTGRTFRAEGHETTPGTSAHGNAGGPGTAPSPEAFAFNSAASWAEAYRSGALTPLDAAERFMSSLEAFETMDPPLRAFVAIDREDLIEQAERSAKRFREGKPLSLLDGVPVGVKDEVDLRGYPTMVGTKFLGTDPAGEDATAVGRLRAAGALLVGKTNMHEIGIDTTGRNPHFGTPRNPYGPGRYTGGSSSGSAAAVASGLCPAAVGADGGGSIRIPSSLCGVVGLKPTWGRVSERGAAQLCWSVAHLGPIAADARTASLVYALMAGPDPFDPATLGQPPLREPSFDGTLRGLRVGIYRPWFEHASPDVVSSCRNILEGLVSLGAETVEVTIPGLEEARTAHTVTILSEMAAAMKPWYGEHRRDFDGHTRLMIALSKCFTADDYILSQRIRTRIMRAFREALSISDIILTPATALTAPEARVDALAGQESDPSLTVELMRFAAPGNLTGLPAVSFPAGYDAAGLPVGIQAMGRPWEEDLLLDVAYAAEAFVARRKPVLYRDLLGNSVR